MSTLRERVKHAAPPLVHTLYSRARTALSPPPLEDIELHGYRAVADPDPRPRVTLVIPTVLPAHAFGGVTTGIDIFLELGRRLGVDLRIVIDDFERSPDLSVVESHASAIGVDPHRIEVLHRVAAEPTVPVRAAEVFFTYNWWTTLNVRSLVAWQASHFGVEPLPLLYLVQEYEPALYPFSSTHLTARAALDLDWPCWGLFNSSLLHDYVRMQGHRVERSFVFEPSLSRAMRPFLEGPQPHKEKQILVYGRPAIPRNCFPAVEKGLRLWVQRHPELAAWRLLSAGMAHKPVPLGGGRALESVGKLSLEEYARLLQTTSVGLSLMSSPHPSYPPLEMAHFGLRTITNTFANKTWQGAHENILPITDILPETIATALARACVECGRAPQGTPVSSAFLDGDALSFVTELSRALGDRCGWSTGRR